MKLSIAEVLDKQSEIIKLQTEIIDSLSAELLQNGMITEGDLNNIKKAALMQEDING